MRPNASDGASSSSSANKNVNFNTADAWRSDEFLRALPDKIDDYAVLSFDIFDTLLFRAVHEPADVFELTGSKAIERGWLRQPIQAAEFRTIRVQAERAARRERSADGYAEVSLEQIYDQIPSYLLDRNAVKELELDTEKEVCYLNPNMISLLRFGKERGCRIALVSDMYLSSRQMLDLLTSCGFDPSWMDLLLVSSEQDTSKADGGLFDRLLAAFPPVSSSRMLHIGDNYAADVVGARSRGIAALHYGLIPESFDDPFHWESVRHGKPLPELRSLRKLAAHTLPEQPLGEAEAAFYRFGAGFLGPYLHALCEWAVEVCVREGYPAIHPLMREAHALAPMLRRIIQRRGLQLEVFPIHISRQAAFLPSLVTFGEPELAYLMQQNWVKVHDLFVILDIEAELEPFRRYEEMPVRECGQIIENDGVSVRERLQSYLLQEQRRQRILERSAEQRRLFLAMLEQQCGDALHPMVTLDIGFNGTIQRSMQHIARLAGRSLPMVHLMSVGSDRTAGPLLEGMDLRCYIGSAGHEADIAGRIARSPAFLEELMMGREGSTLKYEADDTGRIRPVCARLEHGEEEFAYKQACQLGMAQFQRQYERFLGLGPGLAPDPYVRRREWCAPLHRVIDMPTPHEAGMLGSLTHQDNFCGTRIAPICEPIDDRWFERGGGHFLDICNYGPAVFSANWPQGLLSGKAPYELYRYYLRIRDGLGRQALLYDMMQRLKQSGIAVFRIYGEGELADTLIRLAWFHGLEVDRLVSPVGAPVKAWGPFKTATLEQAAQAVSVADLHAQSSGHVYVSATLQDFDLYRQQIDAAYRLHAPGIVPVIFSFDD